MNKQIELGEKKVEYTLRQSSRARYLRLTIYHNGSFVVTAPHRTHQSLIEKFIIKKSRWVLKKLAPFRSFGAGLRVRTRRGDFLKYKESARAVAHDRINYFKTIYPFPLNRVTIKNQKTRWGSCSKKGNINLNYKIALLPPHLTDYIIVHELCHLAELNHSAKFWELVSRSVPNYRHVRKELRGMSI